MMNRIASYIMVFMLAVALSIGMSADAKSAKSYNKVVQVAAGKAETVDLSGAVADILVANPAVADVGTLRSNRLYIVGRNVGDTNVLVYDDVGNQLANLTISVRLDDGNLQRTLKEFFPDEKVSARTINENIVLSGSVSTPAVANQVRDLAGRFITQQGLTLVDLMSVRGEQQVMLKVRVIEAKRNALRELGVQTGIDELTGANGFNYFSEDSGRSQSPFGTASILFGNRGQYGAIIRALETDGLVNTLAEPNLTAISGETAGFLAGGEYPVPTGRDQDGNATLEFKKFGVSLNFTPTVMSRDRIALHLSTEVSEKDRNNGVELLDTQIDGLSVRRAETTVELASGGTIMIAGLIKSDTLQSMNGLPGIKDLPIIGQLFKSRSFSRGETELIIMVTPYLVNAYADPQAVVEAPAPVPSFANRAIENRAPVVAAAPVPAVTRAAATTPVAAAPKKIPESKPADTPLSRRLMANLKRTYGENRVSGGVGTGQAFGYIVD